MNGDLFPPRADPAVARLSDPGTSHQAARRVNVTARQGLVLRHLHARRDGLTCSEIAARAELPRDSISPRIKPLVEQGLVEDTGARRKPDAHLREQIVWRITIRGVVYVDSIGVDQL